ncbi:response regulator [Amycolatopsis sp. RM579]|uniref:Response regulator n=2 Tax=Amycolatopsis pithecellobii TaxID=664692 RepID=A0A6N7Z516_9PSEU|nr:response regulator [Amycolatopsis pithecellobii]
MVLRCLLVDDSARFLKSARALLEHQGLAVDVASTAAEAAQRVGEQRPDVVLLDIDFGDESGFQLAQNLHAYGRTMGWSAGGPRIIMISTHAGRDFEELIDASPAIGFLAKASLSAGAIQELLRGCR